MYAFRKDATVKGVFKKFGWISRFLAAYSARRSDPAFVDTQRAKLEAWDAEHPAPLAAPTPALPLPPTSAPAPAPPLPQRPVRPRPVRKPAPQAPAAPVAGPSGRPRRSVPTATPTPAPPTDDEDVPEESPADSSDDFAPRGNDQGKGKGKQKVEGSEDESEASDDEMERRKNVGQGKAVEGKGKGGGNAKNKGTAGEKDKNRQSAKGARKGPVAPPPPAPQSAADPEDGEGDDDREVKAGKPKKRGKKTGRLNEPPCDRCSRNDRPCWEEVKKTTCFKCKQNKEKCVYPGPGGKVEDRKHPAPKSRSVIMDSENEAAPAPPKQQRRRPAPAPHIEVADPIIISEGEPPTAASLQRPICPPPQPSPLAPHRPVYGRRRSPTPNAEASPSTLPAPPVGPTYAPVTDPLLPLNFADAQAAARSFTVDLDACEYYFAS